MDKLLASEVAQVRAAVMAFENSVSQEPCYESAEEVVGAAYLLEEAAEALGESAKALRDKFEGGRGGLMSRVIVLSNRDVPSGVLYDADMFLIHVSGDETLAEVVLRTLREEGIDIQDGDVMFFPDAHYEHRLCRVAGDGTVRLRGWGSR